MKTHYAGLIVMVLTKLIKSLNGYNIESRVPTVNYKDGTHYMVIKIFDVDHLVQISPILSFKEVKKDSPLMYSDVIKEDGNAKK